MALMHVYGVNDIDYDGNGAAILAPVSASVTEEAGAKYELTFTHPIDRRGIWQLLEPGNIVRASVPVADIESAFAGEDVDIYRVTASSAKVRAKPIDESRITYATWVVRTYNAGEKVTYRGRANYQALLNITESAMYVAPPNLPSAWKEISSYTPGATVLVTLKPDTLLYLVSVYSSSWLLVQTMNGIQGYIKVSDCVFDHTEHVEETPSRSVSNQLFRIYSVSADSGKKTLTVNARHVSYDLAGNLIQSCAVTGTDAGITLARIRTALLFDEKCTLATNLTEDAGVYTGDFSWKNPVNALLDPDTGLADYFKAKVVRDNWDIFLNKNDFIDRGVRLAYGVNLTGVTWKRDSSQLINRVVPVAQNAQGGELLLEDVWVDSPIIDSYPVIRTEYLKVNGKVGGDDESGGTWTEETLREHMREKAEQRFSQDDADKPVVEITVNFALLGNASQYAQYHRLERLCLYDTIKVTDPTIGLEQSLQVSAYDWDPVLERYNSIKLGNVFERRGRDVSGYNLVDGCIRLNKLSTDTINAIKEAVS